MTWALPRRAVSSRLVASLSEIVWPHLSPLFLDRTHLELAAGLGLGTAQVVRRIVIPSVVPALVTGTRLTFGLTFVGPLIAELLSGSAGRGIRTAGEVAM